MLQEPDLATVAALIAEPSRASMLSALQGGEALPASELAYRAHITPQTASSHLTKLLEGGLVKVEVTGRHRYYSLKNHEVARTLELLQVIAPPSTTHHNRHIPQDLCYARTCYDHLAGRLGVAFTEMLIQKTYLTEANQQYQLTPQGVEWLTSWGIDIQDLYKKRRKFAYPCLDWSERRCHVAGSLGLAITQHFFDDGWIRRIPQSRALEVTDAGSKHLEQEFGITLQPMSNP